VLQNGVFEGQSLSCAHCTHSPLSQTGVDVPAQCAFVVHCTHAAFAVSQCAFGGEQFASLVQPARQRRRCGSQTGAAVPQSPFERHCTHAPSAV
jgi:hypothetical protein